MARITIVHDVAGVGAIEAELLRSAGHQVTHIKLPQPGARWRWPAKGLAIVARLFLYLPVVWKLRRERPDVLHIHWVLMGVIGLLAGQPFFVSAHGSDVHQHFQNPFLRFVSQRILNRAVCVFYSTPNLAALLVDIRTKIVHLPNPVDVTAFPVSVRTSGRNVLLFTRLDPIKGVDVIFPAAAELTALANVTGLAWGPLCGEYMRRYHGIVTFVDPVSHEQVPAFLSRFDVVVGQMRQGSLGLAEVEALAAGFPVVTGIDWTLYTADPPPITQARDHESIVAAVKRLLANPGESNEARHEARAWVERNHGYERHLRILETEYSLTRAHPAANPAPEKV